MLVTGTLDHLDDLAKLFDQYRIFYKRETDIDGAKRFLSERIRNKESIIFVYYEGNKAVGFTQLYPKYSSAMMVQNWILNDLYVVKEYRKCGIGTQLINAAAVFAKSKEAVFLQLSTQVDNTTAQQLYQALGFEVQASDQEFLLFKKLL